jgi:hypothetical protein
VDEQLLGRSLATSCIGHRLKFNKEKFPTCAPSHDSLAEAGKFSRLWAKTKMGHDALPFR